MALGGTAFAQAVGTWKLNLAKSKYQQGQAPKSITLVYEAAGAGIKVTVDQVPADGPAINYTVTANYDGKDVPVVGNPNADTVARTPSIASRFTTSSEQQMGTYGVRGLPEP